MTEQQNTDRNELVFVQTGCVAVSVKGSASHPSLPGISYDRKDASLTIVGEDLEQPEIGGEAELLSMQRMESATTYRYCLQPLFFEQQRYEILIESDGAHRVEFWHENPNIRRCVTPVGRKSTMLSGVINFGNEIGLSDLVILVDGKMHLKMTIEVFPSKISYKEDYKAIVADVTTEVYNLVFEFLRKTYDSFDLDARQQSSPVEFFAILQKIYDEFTSAADMVLAKPHHILEVERQVLPSHKVKRTDNKSIRWLEKHPEYTKRSGDRILAERVQAVKKFVTYDTKENRLTKYMLVSTIRRLEHFRLLYEKLNRDTDDAVIGKIDRMIAGIRRRCNTGFLKDVEAHASDSGMSLVFSMAPGYRDLYRCYLMLQHGLSVTGSVFNVSVKDLAVLYEYWCFIKLNSLMKTRYELLSQDIIKVSGNGLFVSLIKGQRSRVRYRNPENGELITLSYNPKEISVPTVAQKPDNVLRLEKRGAKVNYEYIFDAKYRINAAPEGSYYRKLYGGPGPQEDDINTMHRYRDAIVYENEVAEAPEVGDDRDAIVYDNEVTKSPKVGVERATTKKKGVLAYERTMFGAYVLFPYHDQEAYRNHRFYKSIEQVNIGGLPFLPSATDLVMEMLDELIMDSPESAFERATLPRGIEERLAKVDWSKREVLIGLVESDEQLQSFMEQRCFWIRKGCVAKENLPIYYVALYEKNVGIRWFGRVLSTEKVDEFYQFNIEEWKELEHPIRAEQYGPNSVAYTNYFLLTHSDSYPELHLKNEEEYRFFAELKRRSEKAVMDEPSEISGFQQAGMKVLFDGGEILVFQDGREVERCSVGEFSRRPSATFRRLYRYAEKTEVISDQIRYRGNGSVQGR